MPETEVKQPWKGLDLDKLNEAIAEKSVELDEIFDKPIHEIAEADAVKVVPLNDELAEMIDERIRLKKLTDAKELAEKEKGLLEVDDKGNWKRKRPTQPEGGGKVRSLQSLDIGKGFVESDGFKAFADRKQMNVPMELPLESLHPSFDGSGIKGFKDVLGTDNALAGVDTEFTIQNIRLPGILDRLEFPNVVANLFPQGSTSGNAIVYMEEIAVAPDPAPDSATFYALETEQAATKPEAALEFQEASSPVRKIATWIPVTEELFQDAPALRAVVNNRLRTFVLQREDTQILNGDGAAPDLQGILSAAGVLTQALGADPVPDAVYKATTLIFEQGAAATQTVWNPTTWQAIRLLRTADGVYIWGNPSEAGPQRIWGLPVTLTVRQPTTEVLVGDFGIGAQIFRREGVNLRVADQHADFAITNKIAIIVEERLALVIFRPTAFVRVTGT